jgi:hypothetical protein
VWHLHGDGVDDASDGSSDDDEALSSAMALEACALSVATEQGEGKERQSEDVVAKETQHFCTAGEENLATERQETHSGSSTNSTSKAVSSGSPRDNTTALPTRQKSEGFLPALRELVRGRDNDSATTNGDESHKSGGSRSSSDDESDSIPASPRSALGSSKWKSKVKARLSSFSPFRRTLSSATDYGMPPELCDADVAAATSPRPSPRGSVKFFEPEKLSLDRPEAAMSASSDATSTRVEKEEDAAARPALRRRATVLGSDTTNQGRGF